MRDRINWKDAPYAFVEVPLPECPECGVVANPIRVRGVRTDDPDVSTAQVLCRRCRAPFIVVKEFRQFGESDSDNL